MDSLMTDYPMIYKGDTFVSGLCLRGSAPGGHGPFGLLHAPLVDGPKVPFAATVGGKVQNRSECPEKLLQAIRFSFHFCSLFFFRGARPTSGDAAIRKSCRSSALGSLGENQAHGGFESCSFVHACRQFRKSVAWFCVRQHALLFASFNGRTPDFLSGDRGSSPRANIFLVSPMHPACCNMQYAGCFFEIRGGGNVC